MLELITSVGLAAVRRSCLLKEKSFYLWILSKVIPSYALSVPWLLRASPFMTNELPNTSVMILLTPEGLEVWSFSYFTK